MPVITANGSTILAPGQTVTLTCPAAGGYLWSTGDQSQSISVGAGTYTCLLYTSDAADERSSVDLGGRRIIKKKKIEETKKDEKKNNKKTKKREIKTR